MPKVMLVEDDNNLREIYEARLQAEGYTIVAAKDGEEALVVAKAEKPDLIISDVMMPRISGFEMLDILRNTDGLKDVKVIMLTALGQSDDQQRADRLGADRYLVKSQVTLEDIVKVTHELLQDGAAEPEVPAAAAIAPTPAVPAPTPVAADPVAASPTSDQTTSDTATPAPAPAPEPATPPANPTPEPEPVPEPTPPPAPESAPPVETSKPAEAQAKEKPENDNVKIANKKVIEPLNSSDKPDINTLVAMEEAKEAAQQGPPTPTAVVATNETGQQATPLTPAGGQPQATDFAANQTDQQAELTKGEDPNNIAL